MTAVVVGAEGGLGGRVARALPARGFVTELASPPGDRAALEASFKAAAAVGPITAVVHAHIAPGALQPRLLVEMAEEEWDELADAPVRATLMTLQVARSYLAAGGRIVVVVPSVALTGQDGLVALCTAGEAQRVLTKSAARRWGDDGLIINVVAANLSDLGDDTDRIPTTGVTPRGPALPTGSVGVGADVSEAICLLLGPHAARVTGATLCADGGDLMAP